MGGAMDGYDPSILKELEGENWDEALLLALAYSQQKTKSFLGLGMIADPEELLHEAISRAFGEGANGTYRNWNRERYPTLAEFLISIIDSILSHAVERHSRYKYVSRDEQDEGFSSSSGIEVEEVLYADDLTRPRTPEEFADLSERCAALRVFLDDLAQKDEEVGLVLMAIEDGAEKAKDQAVATGMDVETVYNVRKRLKRKLDEHLAVNGWDRPERMAR